MSVIEDIFKRLNSKIRESKKRASALHSINETKTKRMTPIGESSALFQPRLNTKPEDTNLSPGDQVSLEDSSRTLIGAINEAESLNRVRLGNIEEAISKLSSSEKTLKAKAWTPDKAHKFTGDAHIICEMRNNYRALLDLAQHIISSPRNSSSEEAYRILERLKPEDSEENDSREKN